ncbi:MAG: AraC family transcriptional regulator [Verrucomicrobia bacterium CG_4_10_14_3_um_filter_43_23]|nr:MAG: hypothetical protein AUJ82_00605 [Verrucomicrobia bacterium CG1_02_43_26]PIP59228.1 MAG: AraC family transcriptional regulator [Verrucomicrobia bacterium CG22_combo_CG10-13_8_21_14_all_43_17]PIX58588.1 MAG: AraC family transcriptional regulator [Verrucomicrobia bacterium CG_4_10_14_3_um_filter_43_23]PIY61040.1 MAG: AraC family transcriptional regulator [Verrucomicrobia bacterium CG_4_10_14_0_8_um_filter_43_34]PJA43881.1 MAG: AraC family transcriptional regulator [Verrucomicrobia bacteri
MGLFKIVDKDAFLVRGISVRTNNAAEMSGTGKMPALWARFQEENLLAKIPQVIDPLKVFVVYSVYESDESGDYDYTIGYQVPTNLDPAEGFSDILIEKRSYAVIPSDNGPIPAMIISAWKTIWKLSPEELGGERAYRTDFEVYDSRCADPQNAQVDIFLSLKNSA